jgi:hypothetical protein
MREVRTRIDVRCSKKEKELIEELAKDRGLTVSEFIREKLFGRKMTIRYLDRGQGEKEIKEV